MAPSEAERLLYLPQELAREAASKGARGSECTQASRGLPAAEMQGDGDAVEYEPVLLGLDLHTTSFPSLVPPPLSYSAGLADGDCG